MISILTKIIFMLTWVVVVINYDKILNKFKLNLNEPEEKIKRIDEQCKNMN